MTKELLSQPNVITRILALSSEHEAADLELYSLLSKRWFLVKGLGLLAEVQTLQVNLSQHKMFVEVQAEVRIHRVLILQAEVFVRNQGEHSANGGQLMPWASTSGTGCWCKTLDPCSCAEINSVPTHLQGWLSSRLLHSTCSSPNYKPMHSDTLNVFTFPYRAHQEQFCF